MIWFIAQSLRLPHFCLQVILGLFERSFPAIYRYATQNLVFKMDALEAFIIRQCIGELLQLTWEYSGVCGMRLVTLRMCSFDQPLLVPLRLWSRRLFEITFENAQKKLSLGWCLHLESARRSAHGRVDPTRQERRFERSPRQDLCICTYVEHRCSPGTWRSQKTSGVSDRYTSELRFSFCVQLFKQQSIICTVRFRFRSYATCLQTNSKPSAFCTFVTKSLQLLHFRVRNFHLESLRQERHGGDALRCSVQTLHVTICLRHSQGCRMSGS